MNEKIGLTGLEVLQDPALNKSTAFTEEERRRLKLNGLLPSAVCSQEAQIDRVLGNLRRKGYDIERYIFLIALQGRNERLFYRTVLEHIEEIMPLIYTPTVGQACKEFAHIFRQPRGLYISARDRGSVRDVLGNWPEREVRAIVVTDGERILGLGDLGANGMGIPIGKLALYTACAGIHPDHCLPVMFDVGTNNRELLDDPLYLGVRAERLTGNDYLELMDEFIDAVRDIFPNALIQFEDFATPKAYELLNRYRDNVLCFNDDIQGTAAVVLGGVYVSTRISGTPFDNLRLMFLGAGSAATGIADLMVLAFVEAGLSEQEARARLWLVNRDGLVVKGRSDLKEHSLPYAHDHPPTDFIGAIESIRPHVLIGATGTPGTFTEDAIKLMAKLNERPTIFALSNPTSRAECTAEQAYEWSDGRAIFSSGSPFPAFEYDGRTLRPGQSNNAYIFPGIGLGAVACRATRITDGMFLSAARTLAEFVSEASLETGTIYPPLTDIRSVSLAIATAVAESAYAGNSARDPHPEDLAASIAQQMYQPAY